MIQSPRVTEAFSGYLLAESEVAVTKTNIELQAHGLGTLDDSGESLFKLGFNSGFNSGFKIAQDIVEKFDRE